jgi:type IV pilus assembly protein PilB
MSERVKRLGEILVESKIITDEQLLEGLHLQNERKELLGKILIDEGFTTEKQIIDVLEYQYQIPRVQLNTYDINERATELISAKMARRYTLIPINKDNKNIEVAMADPLNLFAIDDLKLATGLNVKPYLATEKEILLAIEQYYKKRSAEAAVSEFSHKFNDIGNEEEIDLESISEVNNAPVVKLIDSVILQAAESNVSDIHIEPDAQSVRIRFRMDGDLYEHMELNKKSHSSLITRIKIMGYMDIGENRVPQDGRVEVEYNGRFIDLRISVMPTIYGEKAVIRLLDRSAKLLTIKELGMTEYKSKRYERMIHVPNGIILVTGPTGSGKSTSLYATLMEINNIKQNIITVEDPVEYRIKGINQTQVNAKAGLTFANSLRAILRQDPDVIMIGEIRDGETAEIAVRAAITGHLVLSTLHTNDTASSIPRLVNMGVEPYLLSSSIKGIVAQRLVKRICNNCKEAYEANVHELKILGRDQARLYKGAGCNLCNHSGYKGRIAVYEIMPITHAIRTLIDENKSADTLKKTALEEGMTTLYSSCLDLVMQGTTTVDELLKLSSGID